MRDPPYPYAMLYTCEIGTSRVGEGHPLFVIAGPCVLERSDTNRVIARTMRDACATLGLGFVFKASFDKANRTSLRSARGPGADWGLKELAAIRDTLGVPTTTDVHLPEQAVLAAASVDMLQVPAFLCRQTDLLAACAETGRAVNVKKGQFLSPHEMKHVIAKLVDRGCHNIMLTERGTFFGYHRLVNDFIGLGDMMEFGWPVCFDVTHSTQLPGAGAGAAADQQQTGGRPERAALLAKAAVAAGVHAIFIECHPDPASALSDASTMQRLDDVPALLEQLAAIRTALTSSGTGVAAAAATEA